MKNKLTRITGYLTGAMATAYFTTLGVPIVGAQEQLITIPENQKGFFTDVNQLVTRALSLVMVIAAVLVFFYLIWGGIEWITSGGESSKTEKARSKITNAVIGLVVLASAYAILQLALRVIGITDVNTIFQFDN